ncbi:MAG: class I poly(R)-hydroxyalkanoic acid synthase, partial [Candidatus Fonsibacter sp.]
NKTSNNDNKTEADLGSFFEDGIKNYNQYLDNLKTLTDANKDNALLNFHKNNNGKNKYFSANDLSALIAPTVNHLSEIFKSLTAEFQKKPKVYFDTLNEWVTDITKLNFYFISKISG